MADDTIGPGHNSVGPDAQKQLKRFVERIENIETEIAERQEDRKDVYAEAKGGGFDTKTLRKLIARRKLDKAERDAQDEMLELYEGVFS